MMNAVESIKNILKTQKTFTENGDTAFVSCGNYCVDLFALVGGMRHNKKDAVNLFIDALKEDFRTAVKIMFYTRDIRNGLGERDLFRLMLLVLCNLNRDAAIKIIDRVSEYGRWDDLFILSDTDVFPYVVNLLKKQLEKDLKDDAQNKSVSLLAKWLPSINTSCANTRRLALKLARMLCLSNGEYRKVCSKLRKRCAILENNLREKNYAFDYEKVPSQALLKHRNAFLKHDGERFCSFIKNVNEGRKKVHADALYPYQIVAPFFKYDIYFDDGVCIPQEEKNALEAAWKSICTNKIDSNTIIVMDGSGSMYENREDSPINIAVSLAMLCSQKLTGAFHNTFITFSENPQLITLKDDSFEENINEIKRHNEMANTDIGKVYELLYDVAKSGDVKPQDMIKRIVIISDMEFDSCAEGVSSFEYWKKQFENAGYDFPSVVFWNVSARHRHVPVCENAVGVKLVSGASPRIFDMVLNNDMNMNDFMLEVLKSYSWVDEII